MTTKSGQPQITDTFQVNAFSDLVYGVDADGAVYRTRKRSETLFCEVDIKQAPWEPVPATKVPKAIGSWLETHRPAAAPTHRAGLYLRISQDRTGKEAGVRRQEKDCRELAARLGWEVAAVYVDNDVSAHDGKKWSVSSRRRPEYLRMQNDLRAGRIDAVVAWHPDRLYRRVIDLLEVVDLLNETGAEVATVQAGAVDLATPNGRLVAIIGAGVAAHESEHKSERTKAWHRQRAEAGLPNGGRRPFGYCADRVTIDEAEAEIIREGAQRILAGEQRISIVKDWNRRGVATVTGTAWSATMLRQMLSGPRIAGLRQHNGTLHPATWPAILPADEWEAVKAAFQTGKARPGRPASYLLSGFLRCARCGTKMTGNKTTRKVPVYRCPGPNSSAKGCGKLGRNAAAVEADVVGEVLGLLSGPGLARTLRGRRKAAREGDDTVKVISTLEGRLERLKSEYSVEGMWSKAEFVKLKGELDEKLAAAYRRLRDSSDAAALDSLPIGVDLAEWWPAATVEQQRRIIGLVVDHVVIHPVGKGNNRYNPDATEIVWKA